MTCWTAINHWDLVTPFTKHTTEDAASVSSAPAVRFISAAIALNIPFLVCHPDWPLVTAPFIRSLAINCVLFVVPGVPVVNAMTRMGWLRQAQGLWLVFLSLVTFMATIVIRHVIGTPVTAGGVWLWAWVATNLGILLNVLPGGPRRWSIALPGKQIRSVALVFVVAYAMFFFGATRVVPILGDQDDEVQGTAYGLLTHLKPSLLTGRNTEYLFAHPPLLHMSVAGSILYYDKLDEFAVYDSLSPNRLTLEQAYQRYAQHPYLLETRTPNLFFAAFAVVLMWGWAGRMTGSAWFAALVTAVYATSPEVFVRSSYGGYFAIGAMCLLHMLLAVDSWMSDPSRLNRRSALLAGAMAAVADHKMMLLPGAVVAWEFLRARRWNVGGVARALRHPVVLGFAAGLSLFWLYGLSISPRDFWMDHVRHHLVDRVLNYNARGLNMAAYPSVPALWLEFIRHTGYLFLPLGTLALGVLCFARLSDDAVETDRPAHGWRGIVGVWAVWAVVTAVAFSIIDWRQTKHLAPLMFPLTLGIASAGRGLPMRKVLGVLMFALLLWNVRMLYLLTLDFNVLPAVPEW